jgi:hypothetical protein
MKRIDSRTVELTDKEIEATNSFADHLSAGHTIVDAARLALIHHRLVHPKDDAFIDYLSEGRCERKRNTIKVKPQYRVTTTIDLLTAEEMRLRLGLVSS